VAAPVLLVFGEASPTEIVSPIVHWVAIVVRDYSTVEWSRAEERLRYELVNAGRLGASVLGKTDVRISARPSER